MLLVLERESKGEGERGCLCEGGGLNFPFRVELHTQLFSLTNSNTSS